MELALKWHERKNDTAVIGADVNLVSSLVLLLLCDSLHFLWRLGSQHVGSKEQLPVLSAWNGKVRISDVIDCLAVTRLKCGPASVW
jgi:hypothetical protein